MGSIGRKNKNIEIKYSEKLIQQYLRYNFLSPSSVNYMLENLKVYNWESDFLKITKSGYVYEFEIKISRADFKNDFKNKKDKHSLLENKDIQDNKPNYFYYIVPENLITESDVPEYAGLIYFDVTMIHDNIPWYSLREIKPAPKLHNQKFDVAKYNLIEKFYYNYRHWKLKHENDLEKYNKFLIESKTFDDKVYKYSLPEANDKIKQLNEIIQNKTNDLDMWKKMYHHENGLVKRLSKELNNIGGDANKIINDYEDMIK